MMVRSSTRQNGFRLLAMLLVVFTALILTGSQARAATCSWDSCYGKNPVSSGCAGQAAVRHHLDAHQYYQSTGEEYTLGADLMLTYECQHQVWLYHHSISAHFDGYFFVRSCTRNAANTACASGATIYRMDSWRFHDTHSASIFSDDEGWTGMVPANGRGVQACYRNGYLYDHTPGIQPYAWSDWICSSWFRF